MNKVTDASLLANALETSFLGVCETDISYSTCSNKECLWRIPPRKESIDRSDIKELTSIGQSKTERCPSCLGFFQSERILTVASPFIVMYGDGGKLGDYPTKIKLRCKEGSGKQILPDILSYVGIPPWVYGAEPRMDIIIHLFQNSTKGSGTITKYSTPIL